MILYDDTIFDSVFEWTIDLLLGRSRSAKWPPKRVSNCRRRSIIKSKNMPDCKFPQISWHSIWIVLFQSLILFFFCKCSTASALRKYRMQHWRCFQLEPSIKGNYQIHVHVLYRPFDSWVHSQIIQNLRFVRPPIGYIDVGDGCWRPNVLVTSLRCWRQKIQSAMVFSFSILAISKGDFHEHCHFKSFIWY